MCFAPGTLKCWMRNTSRIQNQKCTPIPCMVDFVRYFDNAVLMVAMCKAGVELAFEEMVAVGMTPESAYVLAHARTIAQNIGAPLP